MLTAVSEPPIDPHRVARRLAALPELQMRAAVLRDIVRDHQPPDAAWLLDALATAGRAGGPPFDMSLLAAVQMTSGDVLAYRDRRRIYEAADRHGLEACKELLYTVGFEAGDDPQRPRALIPGTRPLTLGERKALARSWKRDVLERLVLDPSADVVKLLLDNPRITETDVLRLSTARRASAAALGLVLTHKRWSVRPRVRRALLRNPNLPEAAAVRLVGLLNRVEQRELARDPKLPLRVTAALIRRLKPHA